MNRRFIHILLFFFGLILRSGLAYAQCGTLSGLVLDEDENMPLEFANVYINELQRGGVSKENGEYIIENVCDGVYLVRISHVGCEPKEMHIEVKGNTVINFFLPHSSNILKEVWVVEKRPEQRETNAKVSLTGREFDESRGESLGEALKRIPGVSSLETGNSISKPIIHGLHSNRILIFNNGIRQEGQQWGSEHAPEVDPFIGNELTVIKGAGSVRYGSDAIAGVVLVEPKLLRDSAGIGGELNLIGFSNNRQGVFSGTIEQNFRKYSALSWRLQGTLIKAGNAKTPDYWLKNTGFSEKNFSYAVGWNKKNYGAEVFYSQFNSTIGIFSGSHIGNLTDLQAAFNRSQPIEESEFSYDIDRPYQHVEHELFKVKSFLNTGAKSRFRLVYARQYNLRYEYDKHKPLNDSLAALNLPELQYEITTHSADIIWEHERIKSFRGSIGICGMTQGNTYQGRFFIPNYRNNSAGVFIIERWKKNRIELEAGLRYDLKFLQVYMYDGSNNLISPTRNFKNVSGSLGSIYTFNPHLILSFNVGSAWRAPGVNELYSKGLHHGAASVEIGNEELEEERAYNFILTANYQNHRKLSGEISLYNNYINNFIYMQPAMQPVLTIRGAFPSFNYQQTDASLKGIDLTLNYNLVDNLRFTTKASFLRAINVSTGEHLLMMPSDRFENQLTYDFGKLRMIERSYLSLSMQHVTRQKRVPANSDFAASPEGYTLFNFDAGISFRIQKQLVDIGFSGNNILNTVYRDYLNRFRYYSDNIGRSFSLRIKIPFNRSNKK